MDKHFNVLDVVWARARKPKREVFWPAQVVETEKTPRSKKKPVASVRFLGENTYEDVKDIKDIMEWGCKEQCNFIKTGRATIKKPEKKICFNKGLAEAKKIFDECKQHTSNKTIDEQLGSNSNSQIRFVDESKIVPAVAEQSKTSRDGSEKSSENNKSGARKRVNFTNDSGKSKSKADEPKVKRPKNIYASENLIRRTSPRKKYGTDSPTSKVEMNKREHISGKDISNEEQTSRLTPFVDKNIGDINIMKNETNSENSTAVNRKRKREKKEKETYHRDPNCESNGKDSNSSEETKQLGKNETKIKLTKKQLAEQSQNKKPFPDMKEDGKPYRMECKEDGKPYRMECKEDKHLNDEQSKDECESDSCSDEELMETALSPSQKDLKFEFNDIVWAKLYRDPFWPAVVRRITGNKKTQKIYVKFLGYDNETCFSCRRLAPFACDSDKLNEFKVAAEKHDCKTFQQAFEEAEDLVRRKALGIKPIDGEEDEEAREKVCKFVNDNVKEATLVGTEDKPQERTDIRRLTRVVKKPSKYKDILTYVRKAKPFLKEIFEEKKLCDRHQIFKKGSAKDKNSLKHRSGFGPISDSDLENDIMELLLKYYRELVGNKQDFSEVTYISDVWLPEAIIYALQKIDNVDRRTAESLYQQGSSLGTLSHRFTERLKAKTLTEQEKEESLERAESAFLNL